MRLAKGRARLEGNRHPPFGEPLHGVGDLDRRQGGQTRVRRRAGAGLQRRPVQDAIENLHIPAHLL